jgi:glycosyltransferase involved in cell wall biosynthesis
MYPDSAPATKDLRQRRISVLLLTTSYPLRDGSVSGIFVQRLARAISRYCTLRVLVPDDAEKGVARRRQRKPFLITFRYAPKRLQKLAHGAGGIPAALGQNRMCALLLPPFLLSMSVACWRRASRCDVLFANWSVCGVVAGVIGRVRGLPVVVALRGQDVNRIDQSRLLRAALYLCIRLCDRIVAVSQAMADTLAERVPECSRKLTVIPNGVSAEFLDVPSPAGAGRRLHLLCIASLISSKSVATLIQAMAALSEDVGLTLVGEGPEAAGLIELSHRLGVHDRIEFLPFQSPARLPALFSRADIFVLPSLAEGRSNVMLEAFAASRPVVASDIDGVRELIADGRRGLLFPPGDANALADCVRKLRDKDLRLSMGAQARQYIIDEGLTWENAARRYEKIFVELAGAK